MYRSTSTLSMLLLVLFLFVAACSAPPQTTTPPSTPPSATAVPASGEGESPAEATSTSEATAEIRNEPTNDTPADSGFPVTITDDAGNEITLEKPAERIIIASDEFIELAIALDIPLVGAAPWRNEAQGDHYIQPPYLDKPIPGEPLYVGGDVINLERVISLQPDLILSHSYMGQDESYKDLARIAPTLSFEGSAVGGWKRAARALGLATGKLAEAEQLIADYDAKVAAWQEQMAPVVEQAPTVTLLLSWQDGTGVFDENFSLGGLMHTLGFDLVTPLGDEMDPSGYVIISLEALTEIEADTVVVLRFVTDEAHPVDDILPSIGIPVIETKVYPGMGYTGPYAELIYLEQFAEGLSKQYLASGANRP